MWCRVLSRKCLQEWVKSSRPINLLQPGFDRGLVSVHITEASIPGAAQPTEAFMNNWCCSDWMETLLCLYFYMKAITVFIDIYAARRSETTKCTCYSFGGSLFALDANCILSVFAKSPTRHQWTGLGSCHHSLHLSRMKRPYHKPKPSLIRLWIVTRLCCSLLCCSPQLYAAF